MVHFKHGLSCRQLKFVLTLLLSTLPVAIFCQARQSTATKKRPNILFCIADDASFEHMSAYGFGHAWVSTPNFDRIAKEGLLFRNAYTPNAKCSPSRSAILTGRNPWQLEEAGNHSPHFPAKFPSFIEVLGENGYSTGYTGKGWGPGNPGEKNGKTRMLTGREYNEVKLTPPYRQLSAIDYAANFSAFLKSKPVDQPFFFWFGAQEPHRAYAYASGAGKGQKSLSSVKQVPSFWPDSEPVRNDMLDYAFEVEYFDEQLGKILNVLQASGELENTIIVVTSDNGMPFPRVKGNVYESSNHMPLAVMWKDGIKLPRRVIDDYISFIDFAPTFLEAASVEPASANMHLQGRSLMRMLTSANSARDRLRDFVLLGRERNDVGRPADAGYPVRAIVQNGFLYLKNYEPARWPAGNPVTGYLDADGSPTKTTILSGYRKGQYELYWQLCFGKRPSEELYNLKTDRDCVKNLAADPSYKKIKSALAAKMEKELKAQQDPRMSGRGDVFDQYEYSEERVRNFYQRQMKGEKINAGWVSESDFETKDY